MKNTFVVALFTATLAVMLLIGSNEQPKEVQIEVPYSALSSKTKQQVECLAQNIFFEAGHEAVTGQYAVGMVTMKRTMSSSFPNSVCGVVRQKINNTCQFSWWCNDNLKQKAIKYNYSPAERRLYNQVRKVAMNTYLNYHEMEDPTKGATFYHATYVDPKWKLKKTTVIGNHIFYKRS